MLRVAGLSFSPRIWKLRGRATVESSGDSSSSAVSFLWPLAQALRWPLSFRRPDPESQPRRSVSLALRLFSD